MGFVLDSSLSLNSFFNDFFPCGVVFTFISFLFPGGCLSLRAHSTLIIIQVLGFFNFFLIFKCKAGWFWHRMIVIEI